MLATTVEAEPPETERLRSELEREPGAAREPHWSLCRFPCWLATGTDNGPFRRSRRDGHRFGRVVEQERDSGDETFLEVIAARARAAERPRALLRALDADFRNRVAFFAADDHADGER